MYQLDLATLLHLLAGQTGTVSTAHACLPGLEQAAEVSVRVVAGQIEECRVLSEGQVRLRGHEALEAVLSLGEGAWEYLPDVPHPSPDRLAARVPVRSRVVPLSELALWPRRERALYQLTDGAHSIEQLAHLLSQRIEVVATTLVALEQQHGAIRLAASLQERHEAVTMRGSVFPRPDTL